LKLRIKPLAPQQNLCNQRLRQTRCARYELGSGDDVVNDPFGWIVETIRAISTRHIRQSLQLPIWHRPQRHPHCDDE
jgi:hypothetical protein